jgi:hypothetical protein
MNGKEILVDTNIFLYLLKGNKTLEEILQGKNIYVSFIASDIPLISSDKQFKTVKELQLVACDV